MKSNQDMKNQQNQRRLNSGGVSSHLAANAQQIIKYTDGELRIADALLIEQHLQSCSECHAFFQSARQLNAALENGLERPLLSPSFAARLRDRIEADRSPQSETAYVQQKQRIQMEFEQYSVVLRKRLFRLPNLLDVISYSLVTLMACYLVLTGFGWFTGILGQLWPSLREHGWLVISGAVILASIALAFAIALRDQFRPSTEET